MQHPKHTDGFFAVTIIMITKKAAVSTTAQIFLRYSRYIPLLFYGSRIGIQLDCNSRNSLAAFIAQGIFAVIFFADAPDDRLTVAVT